GGPVARGGGGGGGAGGPGAPGGPRAPGAAGGRPRRCPGRCRVVVRLARDGRLLLGLALLPGAPGLVIDVPGDHPVPARLGARAGRLLAPVTLLVLRARDRGAVPRSGLGLPEPGRPGPLQFVPRPARGAAGPGTGPHGPRARGGRPGGPDRVLRPAFHEFFADAVPEIVPGLVAGQGTAQFLRPGAGPCARRGQPERLGWLPSRGLVPLLSRLLAAAAGRRPPVAVLAGRGPCAAPPGRPGPNPPPGPAPPP